MFLVLMAAVAIMILIFNIVSLKSYFQKKTSLVNLLFSILTFGLVATYLVFLVILSTSLVTVLDNEEPLKILKSPVYMLCSWFLLSFGFIKLVKQKFIFFLYKSVFIEETEGGDQENDLEAQMTEERRKTYKKKQVDVKQVPNFVQKFTSTYFKIRPNRQKVRTPFNRRPDASPPEFQI